MRLLTLMEAPAKRASCLMCCPFFPMMAPTACVGMNKFTTSCSGSCQGEQRFIFNSCVFPFAIPDIEAGWHKTPKTVSARACQAGAWHSVGTSAAQSCISALGDSREGPVGMREHLRGADVGRRQLGRLRTALRGTLRSSAGEQGAKSGMSPNPITWTWGYPSVCKPALKQCCDQQWSSVKTGLQLNP